MKHQLLNLLLLSIALLLFACGEQIVAPSAHTPQAGEASSYSQPLPDAATVAVGDQLTPVAAAPRCILLPELPDWPTAFFVLERAAIHGDILTVSVSYSGGCAAHEFQLVFAVSGELGQTEIPGEIFHGESQDPCNQWITEERNFDLSPLKELYFETYDAVCGTVPIHLLGMGPGEFFLSYEFCRGEPVSVQQQLVQR